VQPNAFFTGSSHAGFAMTNDQNGGQPTDPPGVIALPPVIFVTALVVGFAVEWLSPSMVIASGSRIAPGIVVPIGGIVMIALGILQHRRSRNVPDPCHPDVTVMTSGIYRRTRNPIYIGYILVLAGIGLAANSLWVLVTVIPAYFVMRWGVIAREESYLEAKFG